MGNSSSADKLTDAEATALKHINNKDVASLMKLLEKEPVDLLKLVSFNEDNPENIKNGYDFIHTLLSLDHEAFGSSSSSAVSILKAFKQTIESNKQKNTTGEKLFRETPQFDKFPYSYLQFVIFNNPQDLESFIFLLDNKETFPSPPPASQSFVHDLCSNPRAIELLRHLISSGEFPERFENTSSTNNLDEQMRGSVNSVVIEDHRSFTPLQAACAAVNKLAVQELCVAGLGGSNYGECAETLLVSATAGEQHHNLGSMVLFKNAAAPKAPEVASAGDVADILLCLLAQPNAGSAIRKHRLQLSGIQSQKARYNIVAVFRSQFNISSLDSLNLMHLAFAFYGGLSKNNSNRSSADTFLKTVLDNKLAVCTPEELTLSSGIVLSPSMRSGEVEVESTLKLIDKYRLREWMIASEQEINFSSCGELVDNDTLQRVASALPSLQSLNLRKCDFITDDGLEHLAQLSSLSFLDLSNCNKITDTGLQRVTKLLSLESLNLYACDKITDSGLQHLAKLSHLQSLNLQLCSHITDSGLQHLATLSSLKSLNLQNCKLITNTGLEHLAKLPSLQTLNLQNCKLITHTGLQHLAKVSSLQSLNLYNCDRITDSGLQHLSQLSSLQSLNLRCCDNITDNGVQFLATLSSLHSLNLGLCVKITDTGLQQLATLSSLRTLNLTYCWEITDSGVRHLAKLSFLQTLDLSHCHKITDSGLQHLAKLTHLQSLNIGHCYNTFTQDENITDSGLQHLAKLSHLQSLNLERCGHITNDGLVHLAKLLSLQSLNLGNCKKITDTGLERLGKLSSLQSLNLEFCKKITDSGLQQFVKLSSLQSVNLENCDKITDRGLEHLAQLPSLQSLNIQDCSRITDNGIRYLAKLPSLQSLNLRSCDKITNAGLHHLANLSLLQSLDVSECNEITDSGLEHLAKVSSLRSLNLYRCSSINYEGRRVFSECTKFVKRSISSS